MTEKAEKLQAEGKPQEATVLLVSVRQMGLRLMSATPRDAGLMVTGLSIAGSRSGAELLRKIYRAENATTELANLDRLRNRLVLFREEFRRAIKIELNEKERKLVLAGRINPIEEVRVRLQEALVKSGLANQESSRDPVGIPSK